MTTRLRPTTAVVRSTGPVAQYRGQVYTQSVGVRFDEGVSCTVFYDGPTLSGGEQLSAVALASPAGRIRSVHSSEQSHAISPDEREGDWAHEVTGEVVQVEDDGRVGITVDGVPVWADIQPPTEPSESVMRSLDRGDDVTVFVWRLDLQLVE